MGGGGATGAILADDALRECRSGEGRGDQGEEGGERREGVTRERREGKGGKE